MTAAGRRKPHITLKKMFITHLRIKGEKIMKLGIEFDIYGKGHARFGKERYKKIKEHGFSGVMIDFCRTETPVFELSEKESDKILLQEKKLADEAGVIIDQVHGPWRWPARDFSEEDRTERMEKMKKSIHMTAVLGSKNWVIHPLMPFGIEEKGTDDEKRTWDINFTFMSELLKTAKENDVTICLENMPMPKLSIGKPEDVLKFVKTMNDDNFKICFDTGHVSFINDMNVGEEVRRLGSEIRALHVHDNNYGLDLHLMPRLGKIDWEDFAKALKEIQYKGMFTLETVPPTKLFDKAFEDMTKLYATVANQIIADL